MSYFTTRLRPTEAITATFLRLNVQTTTKSSGQTLTFASSGDTLLNSHSEVKTLGTTGVLSTLEGSSLPRPLQGKVTPLLKRAGLKVLKDVTGGGGGMGTLRFRHNIPYPFPPGVNEKGPSCPEINSGQVYCGLPFFISCSSFFSASMTRLAMQMLAVDAPLSSRNLSVATAADTVLW